MVQVDVFWSFGIGAGIALANAQGLRLAHLPRNDAATTHVAWGDPLRDTLLFLSVAFAPSGLYLLTAFPSWETMHVARSFADLPPWLVTVFAATNVTQGIAGYKLAEWAIRRDRAYGAFLGWIAGYFAMFFTLVHGWDGTGYKRFFSATPAQLPGWTWADAAAFPGSPVGLTLLAMGVVIVPWLLLVMAAPLKAGYALDPDPAVRARGAGRTVGGLALAVLFVNTIVVIALAVVASAAVHLLGWVLGALASAALGWALFRPGTGPMHRVYRAFVHAEPLFGTVHPVDARAVGVSSLAQRGSSAG